MKIISYLLSEILTAQKGASRVEERSYSLVTKKKGKGKIRKEKKVGSCREVSKRLNKSYRKYPLNLR